MLIKPATMICAAACAFTMAGCASTNDVLHQEADEVFHTSMNVDEVSTCFEGHNHRRVLERSDGVRVFEVKNGYGGVVRAFSIYPDAGGSRIEVRHSGIDVPGYVWKQCVGLKPMKRAVAVPDRGALSFAGSAPFLG